MQHLSKFLVLHSFKIEWAAPSSFMLARDKTIRNLRAAPGGFAFLHRTHGSSITGVHWPFAIGWSDGEERLSFYSEKTAVPSLPLPGERGKIVRGLFVIGRNSEMLGQHKLFQRYRLFCLFPRTGLASATKTLVEGLKSLFCPAKAQPLPRIFHDANGWFPERNWELSCALVSDGSFSCLATQTKAVSPQPDLTSIPRGNVQGCAGLNCSHRSRTVSLRLLSCILAALSSSPPSSPSPQVHSYYSLEGAWPTRIGSAVIGVYSPLPLFSLRLIILIMTAYFLSLYHQETKRNS